MNKKEIGELKHNINNPLSIIALNICLLKAKATQEELKRLESIEKAVVRISGYLKELGE